MPSFEYAADRNRNDQDGTGPAPVDAFIGRAVVSPNVLHVAHNLRTAQDELLTIVTPPTPSIVYFHSSWIRNLKEKGMAKSNPRLANPPNSPVPERIYAPQDLLTAISSSRNIDGTIANSPMELSIKKVRAKRDFRRDNNTYNLALVAYDKPNDFYDEGFALRGESKILGKLRNFKHSLPAIDPDDPIPTHFIKLAEISLPQVDREASDAIIEQMRKGVFGLVGDLVELSPIQLVT
ncbi:MAG TPA: hypothetical protein VFI84_01285 [Candidatus Saccharimonadales bacterium]|nr:hypothetical protein [Candidatus Saccharimonadales bacterium]